MNGPQSMTIRQIMNTLEQAAGRGEGSTGGPMFPAFDYVWDFFSGTTSDVNMSRMHDFYEQNLHLANEGAPEWGSRGTIQFENWYRSNPLREEHYAHPTMGAYKCVHTD